MHCQDAVVHLLAAVRTAMCLVALWCVSGTVRAQGGGVLCQANDFLGSFSTPIAASAVAVVDGIAYVVDVDAGLQIIDVSNPAVPTLMGAVDLPNYAYELAVVGNTAYVVTVDCDDQGNCSGSLQIIDVSDPSAPTVLSWHPTPGGAVAVSVVGTRAYVAVDLYGLQIFDVTDGSEPFLLGALESAGWKTDVAAAGSVVYLTSYTCPWGHCTEGVLEIIDASNPAAPDLVGLVLIGQRAMSVAVSGTAAYVVWQAWTIIDHYGYCDWGGMQIIDVSVPSAPIPLSEQGAGGCPYGVAISESRAYIASGQSLNVIDVSDPAAPEMLGSYSVPGYATAVAVVDNIAYVADGALRTIDVSNPLDPVLGSIFLLGYPTGMEVVDSTAYVAFGGYPVVSGGLQILDVSDGAAPMSMGSYAAPDDDFNAVTVVGTTAYVAKRHSEPLGSYGVLEIVDVSNPAAPSGLGSIAVPGTQASDVAVEGTLAYVTWGDDWGVGGLEIIDVSDPTAPALLASYEANSANAVAVVGTLAYVAEGQGYPSASLRVIDVSIPTAPSLIGTYSTPEDGWHVLDLTVVGTLAYLATTVCDYSWCCVPCPYAHGGLQIVDVSNPTVPTLLGTVDTPGAMARGLTLVGTSALLALSDPFGAFGSLQIVDVSSPRNPALIGSFATSGNVDVAAGATTAYLMSSGALLIIDVSDCPECLAGDLDCDGVIGPADLGQLLAAWGPCPINPCAADLNGDGTIDGADLGALLGNWS